MFKWILGISIFCFLVGCSLNATQEKALNLQLGLFLKSLNDPSRLAVVSRTHPAYVRYVRDLGPDYFKHVFETVEQEDYTAFDREVVQMKARGSEIQVHYKIKSNEVVFELVAISSDDGKSWFFMPHDAYMNMLIGNNIPRLLL